MFLPAFVCVLAKCQDTYIYLYKDQVVGYGCDVVIMPMGYPHVEVTNSE